MWLAMPQTLMHFMVKLSVFDFSICLNLEGIAEPGDTSSREYGLFTSCSVSTKWEEHITSVLQWLI